MSECFSDVPLEVYGIHTVEKIEGPLRLAKKYMMETLDAYLVSMLTRDWPATLRAWAAFEEDTRRRIAADVEDERFGPYGVNGIDFRLYYADPGT